VGKSKRALHWAESKHPRDNRGRFAKKGGGKWLARVGEQAKAAFGDVSLGYRPGEQPQGRLTTGKGGLIDIGGLHKAAKAASAAKAPTGGGKVNPQSLSVGDRYLNAHGVEHEVIGEPQAGRRAGQMVTRVKVRRVADGKEGPVTLDGPVSVSGSGGGARTGRVASGTVNADGGNFADDLRKEMSSQNDLAKQTARGPRPPQAKLPTTRTGNINPKPARAENRAARNAAGKVDTPRVSDDTGSMTGIEGRTGRTASGDKVEGPTGIDRVMKARSAKEKSAAFAALSSDEIVQAFQRDPGKALDAYMEKNFGKGSGRETALPPAVDNIAANLKAKNITPDQAAEQMRQWARLHAGMQHHRYMVLAADLTDGTVAKRRGNVDKPKSVETRRHQTFAERMAGDMSEADRRAAHAASDENRARLRAREAEQARQRAEAAANDTRTEREKLTELLQEQRAVRDVGMRSGRVDPKREARIKAAETRLAELDTEDRHAKLKDLGVEKGDKIKTDLGEFEVTGTTKDGYLRVLRPDGRRGNVDPKHIGSVTKSAASQEKAAAARDRKITALEKKVEALQSRVSIASGKRKDSGARIQSGAESKANAQLQTARFELHELQRQKSMEVQAPKAEAGGRPGAGQRAELDTSRVPGDTKSMTANDDSKSPFKTGQTTPAAGPVPAVEGYVKGREVRPGMLINAADLLDMSESQGYTSGENPNPLGHAEWVRVGMIGNTNTPGFKEAYGSGTLTGGMYVILDSSGKAVGRMSANTIVEMSGNVEGHDAHALDTLRMPAKVPRKVVKRGLDGQLHDVTEMVDGFVPVHVPSKAAREELGLPAPKLRSDGILDPADPNYGAKATHPTPAHRPFGGPVPGTRSRAEAAADRAKRRDVYASGEDERARRRAEAKAREREQAAADLAQREAAAEVTRAERRETDRRKSLRDWNTKIREIIDAGGESRYDPARRERVLNTDIDAIIHEQLRRYGEDLTKRLARAYGVKWRGRQRNDMVDDIIAAVKAGKTPDEEVDAPKVKPELPEADKIAAADKRRRNGITKDFEEIRTSADRDASFHLNVMMSDNARSRLAEAFHLVGLTGRALSDAIIEAIKAGQKPDLDAAPITSLPKKARR
jgi:hypothetical protein